MLHDAIEVIMKPELYKIILIALAGALPVACDSMYGDAAERLNPKYLNPVYYAQSALSKKNRIGGTGSDAARSLAICPDHGFVVAGYVTGDADLDGDQAIGASPETASGASGGRDILISRFDRGHKLLWSKRLGGTGADEAYGAAVDPAGNIIIVASVYGAADLNGDGIIDASPSRETPAAGVNGDSDIAIIKFSSKGELIWARRLGGLNHDEGFCVAVDRQNNVIVCGTVEGTADLNGDGDTADPSETQSGVYGLVDAFVAKLDSDGNTLWFKRIGGASNDGAKSAAADTSGNIIIGGHMIGNADLNGDGDTSDSYEVPTPDVNGASDAFVSVFGSDGNHVWSKRLGGVGSDQINAVASDSAGNVIVAGWVYQYGDLDGDSQLVNDYPEYSNTDFIGSSAFDNDDIFVSVFDSTGIPRWSRRMGGVEADSAMALAITFSDEIVVAGSINGPADMTFNGDVDDIPVEQPSLEYLLDDVFISIIIPDGSSSRMIKRIGGENNDYCYSVAADDYDSVFISGSDNIIIAGSVIGNAQIGGDSGYSAMYPDIITGSLIYGAEDMFAARIFLNSSIRRFFYLP